MKHLGILPQLSIFATLTKWVDLENLPTSNEKRTRKLLIKSGVPIIPRKPRLAINAAMISSMPTILTRSNSAIALGKRTILLGDGNTMLLIERNVKLRIRTYKTFLTLQKATD
jgi:hypothetical protein